MMVSFQLWMTVEEEHPLRSPLLLSRSVARARLLQDSRVPILKGPVGGSEGNRQGDIVCPQLTNDVQVRWEAGGREEEHGSRNIDREAESELSSSSSLDTARQRCYVEVSPHALLLNTCKTRVWVFEELREGFLAPLAFKGISVWLDN